MQHAQDIHFSPTGCRPHKPEQNGGVNNQFPGSFHTTVATFIRLPGQGCWLNNQSVRPVQWRSSGSAPQCTHECASCPWLVPAWSRISPSFTGNLPAHFIPPCCSRGFDHVMGKHIAVLELLTSCRNLVTEPGYYAAVQRSGA